MRSRQLARELRELRENQNLSPKEAANSLGWSLAKISRIENARVTVSTADVANAIELYGGVDSGQRAALIQLAREAQKRGWWTDYNDVFKGAYAALEDEASTICAFEPLLVPGLLQTGDYARTVIEGWQSRRADQSTDRRVQARLARQALLTRPDAPQMHFVLGEAVLRQQVGGTKIMQEQLVALWEASTRPNVTIQVVPFTATAHYGLDGSFVRMGFEDAQMQIAYAEGQGGGIYLESRSDLEDINDRWDGILSVALSPQASANLFVEQTK